MSDNNALDSTTVDQNLDDFAAEFFNKKKAPEAEVKEEVHNEDGIVDDEDVVTDDEAPETEAEEAEDESHEEDDSDDGRPQEEPKKKRNVQERINELTRERYEAERRELETLRQLEALKAEVAQLRKPAEPAKVEVKDAAPDPEAKKDDGEAKYPLGEFDPQYIRDLARFTIKQEQEAADTYRKEAEAARVQEEARNASQARFTEKLVQEEAENPEIRNKIMSLEPVMANVEPRYAQYLIDVARELDNGPKVLAYLADNPKTARDIVNSGAAAATVALGRLDAQLTKKPVEQKKVTKAPEPPVRTRGTSGKVAVTGDTDDLDAFTRVFFKPKR